VDFKAVDVHSGWFSAIAFIGGFSDQAVMIFFVLSGWLVSGSLFAKFEKSSQPYLEYAIDRVSRLWVGLVPALLLSAALFYELGIPGSVDPKSISATAFAGNLFGLQTIAVPIYGDNYPLWSLSNETVYYVMFPLVAALILRRTGIAAKVLLAAILAGLAAILPAAIVLYGAIWGIGVLGRFARVPAFMSAILFGALVALAIGIRVLGLQHVFFVQLQLAALVALSIAAFSGVQTRWPLIETVAAKLASFSFTLYIIHVPIIYILVKYVLRNQKLETQSFQSAGEFLGMFIVLVGVAFAISLVTEANTGRCRAFFRKVLAAIGARTPQFGPDRL
jgi:peptidoglycan/LPS O-acetylase OafA/YrhL